MALTKSVDEITDEDRTGLLGKHPSYARVRLRDVAEVVNGYPFESQLFNGTAGTPLIRIRDVLEGHTSTFYEGTFEPRYVVQPGEFLVGMDGDFNSARWRSAPALLNQRVCLIRPKPELYEPRLLERALPLYLAAIHAQTSSVTVKHLSSRTVEDIGLPLPPLGEQRRLVDKLDEVLSGLDAAVAELQAAKKKLTQYRQSLLKAAVEGALTAEWRAQSPPKETGAELLARILRERRARWEARQLEKFKTQGKEPPTGWRTKYTEPVGPIAADLPMLPLGWAWATLGQLLLSIRSGTAETSGRTPSAFPVLKSSAVRQGAINFDALNYLGEAQCASGENYVELGDILITRLSGSVEYVGCCAVVSELPASKVQYPDRIFCGKPAFSAHALAALVMMSFQAPLVRALIETAAKSTAGHKRISLSDLPALPIALPPHAEIEAIVEAVEVGLSSVAQTEPALQSGLRLATAQRQNILRAAFSGQLVPQDPNDEPASVLLQRIHAERAQAGNQAPARHGRKLKARP